MTIFARMKSATAYEWSAKMKLRLPENHDNLYVAGNDTLTDVYEIYRCVCENIKLSFVYSPIFYIFESGL